MTATELLLILGNILQALGTAAWRLLERHDRNSDLSDAKAELQEELEELTAETEKLVRTHDETMAAKNREIDEWRRRYERLEDRAMVLQDRLYGGGQRP